jgi:hypothetical protein
VGDDGFVREPHPAHTGVAENQHGRVVHRGTKGSNPLCSSGESGTNSSSTLHHLRVGFTDVIRVSPSTANRCARPHGAALAHLLGIFAHCRSARACENTLT